MLRPDHPPIASTEPLVTFVPALGKMSVAAADGEHITDSTLLPTAGLDAAVLSDSLAAMYLECGPSTRSLAEIAAKTGQPLSDVLQTIHRLAGVLPADLLDTEGTTRIPHKTLERPGYYFSHVVEDGLSVPAFIKFGAMRLASRQPTPEEVASQHAAAAAKKEARAIALEERRMAAIEADAEKVDITQQDHALITLHGHKFYIPFESRTAIIAARSLEVLASLGKQRGQYLYTAEFYAKVWQAMSLAERRMYTSSDAMYASRSNAIISKDIDLILGGLTNRMGITRRGRASAEYELVMPSEDISVDYHEDALNTAELQTVSVVLPPGAPRSRVDDWAYNEPLPDDIAFAELTLETISPGNQLGHRDSIDILGFVMGSTGKQALRAILEKQNRLPAYQKTLAQIHLLLRASLGGTSYWEASRARMIKGYGSKGSSRGVQQVSGKLPTLTKWHIGVMSDAQRAAQHRD
jgi:hypothetical protein